MNTKKDYSELVGCWIDAAIPRDEHEITQRLRQLASFINANLSDLPDTRHYKNDPNEDFYNQDMQEAIDVAINLVLNPNGFLAVWDCGDYIVFHESEYFADERDYLTA